MGGGRYPENYLGGLLSVVTSAVLSICRAAMRSPLRFFTIKHLMHFQVQRTVCKYSKSEPGFGSWPWLPKASPKAV